MKSDRETYKHTQREKLEREREKVRERERQIETVKPLKYKVIYFQKTTTEKQICFNFHLKKKFPLFLIQREKKEIQQQKI